MTIQEHTIRVRVTERQRELINKMAEKNNTSIARAARQLLDKAIDNIDTDDRLKTIERLILELVEQNEEYN